MADFSAVLRPQITEKIVQWLEMGEAVHVVAAEGQGATQVLLDIKAVKKSDENALVINISLKNYVMSFTGFLEAIWRMLPVDKRGEKPADLAALVDKLEALPQKKWLLIDEFDAIFDNEKIDALFNQRFIDSFNSLRNSPQFAVLIVTHKALTSSTLFIEKMPVAASVLSFSQVVDLPKLSQSDITQELARHSGIKTEDSVAVREAVYKHPQAYDFLKSILPKLESGEQAELAIEQRLQTWDKAFKEKQYLTLRNSLRWREKITLYAGEAKRWLLVPVIGSLLYTVWQWVSGFWGGKN